MPTVMQHLLNRLKLGRTGLGRGGDGTLLVSSEDGGVPPTSVSAIVVGGDVLTVDGSIAFLHASVFNATFDAVVNDPLTPGFDGKDIVEKGYTAPSVTLTFNSTNPSVYPYCNYENMKMNGSGITLDSANPTLTTDTYTPGGGISEAQEGSGFSVTIRGGNSCDKTADKIAKITWAQYAYYGYNANSVLSESQIEALNKSSLKDSLGSNTYLYGANPGTTYLWFCFPDSWGNIVNIFDPVANLNVTADWTDIGVVSVTNAQSYTEDYRCWRTIYQNSGSDWQMRIS